MILVDSCGICLNICPLKLLQIYKAVEKFMRTTFGLSGLKVHNIFKRFLSIDGIELIWGTQHKCKLCVFKYICTDESLGVSKKKLSWNGFVKRLNRILLVFWKQLRYKFQSHHYKPLHQSILINGWLNQITVSANISAKWLVSSG